MQYVTTNTRVQLSRSYKEIWEQNNPVLLDGEVGIEKDTNKIKIGNGINGWNSLPYFSGEADVLPIPPVPVVTDYRSSFESDLFIYSGYNLDDVPVIKRVQDDIEEVAVNVTNLEIDWSNRLNLTYN